MGDSADFVSYVVARWPAVVRTLVLMGHPPAEAEELAVQGLSRCRSGFERALREGDVDVFVYRTVLGSRTHRRSDAAASTGVPAAVTLPAALPDFDARSARLSGLRSDLATMPPEAREAEALRLAAELDDVQVAEVLGAPALTRLVPDHEAVEAIAVRSAPVDEILATDRVRRLRRTRWVGGVTAGVLAVTGLATWLGTRTPADDVPEPVVTAADNPADVAWYANRLLHLDRVTVEVPEIASMVEVPDGVVYADRAGRVVLADQEGRLSLLGLTTGGLPVVGNGDGGTVGWLEVGDEGPAMVAWDTLGGRELARQAVPADAHPVALDDTSLFYLQDDQSWSWDFATEVEPGSESVEELLDVSSGVRISAFSPTSVRVSPGNGTVIRTMPGHGAQISPDGDFVLTRVDFGRPDEVRIYEVVTGAWVDSGLRRREIALVASLGDDHTVTYVVAHREHAPEGGEFVRLSESGGLLLRSCDLDAGTCETVSQFANEGGDPVLPG